MRNAVLATASHSGSEGAQHSKVACQARGQDLQIYTSID